MDYSTKYELYLEVGLEEVFIGVLELKDDSTHVLAYLKSIGITNYLKD